MSWSPPNGWVVKRSELMEAYDLDDLFDHMLILDMFRMWSVSPLFPTIFYVFYAVCS